MKSVVAVRFSALGDVVLTLPALARLRTTTESVRVIYVTKPPWAALLRFSPLVDMVLPLLPGTPVTTLACGIRLLTPEALLDFHNNLRSHALSWALSGLPTYRTRSTRIARLRHLRRGRPDSTPPPPPVRPVAVQHLETVNRYLHRVIDTNTWPPGKTASSPGTDSALDPVPATGPLPLFIPPEPARSWVSRRVHKTSPAVALIPGASHANKRWPPVRFRELAARLDASGIAPLVFGGPSELDRMDFVAQGARHAVRVPPSWDLVLAGLERAALAVGNDTGLTHLAEALLVPVVALFGPTAPAFGFAPRLQRSTVLERRLPCRPCSLHGGNTCPAATHACLEQISVNEVLHRVLEGMETSRVAATGGG